MNPSRNPQFCFEQFSAIETQEHELGTHLTPPGRCLSLWGLPEHPRSSEGDDPAPPFPPDGGTCGTDAPRSSPSLAPVASPLSVAGAGRLISLRHWRQNERERGVREGGVRLGLPGFCRQHPGRPF
jgi:hypothetical protein